MSRVDVIVPCYKYGRFLEGCVQSALSQEGVDVRVLILDDASPDNTEAVGRQLAERDSRVEYRRHAVNRGHIDTYNEGIAWASGDYMLLLSADDLLMPGALSRAVSLMDQHPEVGLAHGQVIRIGPDQPEVKQSQGPQDCSWRILSGWDYIHSICQSGENDVATPTAVVRTSIQQKVGGYRKELPHAGDMEMWLRIAAFSSVASTDTCQAYYRMHGQNMSGGYCSLRDLQQRKDAFGMFFQVCGEQVKDASRLQAAASRGVSREALWSANKAFDSGESNMCRSLLDFSHEIDPSIKLTKEWKRFRLKRFVGRRVWKTVQPLLALFGRKR